jgi:Fe-S-cluster containining protein
VNGSQLRRIAESVQNGTLWKLGLDDSFSFNCKQCGRCCINNTIIVNTYDVIRMRRTLKMTTNEMVVNNLLSFNVGPNSGMPIATIRFRQINDDASVCPFLAPMYQAKSLDDLKSRIQKDSINTKGLTSAKNRYGEDIFLCSIHPDKPFRCRAYPLGRIFESPEGILDITKADSYWFHVDLPDHCKGPNAKKHTVREWIESQGMKEYLKTSVRCTSMLEKIAKANVLNDEDVSALAFTILYDFDSIMKNEMSDGDTLNLVEKSVDMFIEIASEKSENILVLSQN